MIISNFTRLLNLSIIIIIWACITEILYLLVSYLKLTKTSNKICVYILVLILVLIINYHVNGDILVDEMFYRKLKYEDKNNNINNNKI